MRQFDLHRFIAMDKALLDAFGLADHIDAQPPFGHFFEQNVQLQLGNAGADTAVDAIAE
jgi:hypothetical protein